MVSDTAALVVGIILAIIGFLILAGLIWKFIACSKRITAKVVKVEYDKDKGYWRGTYQHYPTFRYTVDAKEYIVKADTYTRNINKYKVGQEYEIHYNPKSPDEIRTSLMIPTFIISAVFFVFGGTLIYTYFL